MIESQPKTIIGAVLKRDIRDAHPMIGSKNSQTRDCDPTGECAQSCSSCEGSSAASCGTCEGGERKPRR